MSLYCLMEICFLLLQSDVQGLYVLTQSNAVCSCGYDVNVLLINGRFIFLFFFKSLSTAAICREKQYPSSQHPSTVCHILPCTRRWQPCPYLRTAQITVHPIPDLSSFLHYQRPSRYLSAERELSQSGWSLHHSCLGDKANVSCCKSICVPSV